MQRRLLMKRSMLKSNVGFFTVSLGVILLTSTGSDGHRGLYPFDWLIAHQNPTNLTPRKYNDEIELRYGCLVLFVFPG